MADRGVEAVGRIGRIAGGLRRIVLPRQDAAEADAVDLVEAALIVGKLGQIVAAFVTRLGAAAIVGLEDQADDDAEAVVARKGCLLYTSRCV